MASVSPDRETTVLVTRDGMGRAGPALSHKLLQTFLGLLDLEDSLPGTICFYTEGVRMVLENSPVLEELGALQDRGVKLVICGTCVNHYGVADKVRVGEVATMKDILAAQWAARKVITL